MTGRSRGAFRTAAVALAVLALCAGIVALAGDRTAGVAEAHAGAATLSAGVSTHYPCGDPMWLKGRLKDRAGHGVKGVKVTFSFRLTSGVVRRQAVTDARGRAHVKITPRRATAPYGQRVTVKVKAVYRGATLAAATWFTPRYT